MMKDSPETFIKFGRFVAVTLYGNHSYAFVVDIYNDLSRYLLNDADNSIIKKSYKIYEEKAVTRTRIPNRALKHL